MLDRDKNFLPFRGHTEHNAETAVVVLPPKSPNLNAYLEKYLIRSLCYLTAAGLAHESHGVYCRAVLAEVAL
jgi:hypothetical protein